VVSDANGPDGRSRRYQFVSGRLVATGQRAVVVWRDVTGWT